MSEISQTNINKIVLSMNYALKYFKKFKILSQL